MRTNYNNNSLPDNVYLVKPSTRWPTLFRFVHFCVFLVFSSFTVFAQQQIEYSQEAEGKFSAGLSLYKKGEFGAAATVFEQVAHSVGMNHRTTAALVMQAKAELYGNKLDEAGKTLRFFFASYPGSTYIPDAQYTQALVYLKNDEPEQAFRLLLKTLGASPLLLPTLHEEVLLALDEIADSSPDKDLLQRVLVDAQRPIEQEYLSVKIAEQQLERGEYSNAKSSIEKIKKAFWKPTFVAKLSTLEKRLQKPRALKLGVLLPFMNKREQSAGREKEVGMSIFEGIEVAIEEYRRTTSSGSPVTIEKRDTEREPSVAVNGAKELADDQDVIAIIGPAFSNIAAAASIVAQERKIPMITPTANANGIAGSGEYMFQVNPDLDTRAKAIAQYAVGTLKLKRLGVLASNEQSSKILAEAFVAETRRLGFEAVGIEWYDKGTTNLTKQLISLRKKGNAAAQEPFLAFTEKFSAAHTLKLRRLGMSSKLLDTLAATRSIVNATYFLGDNAKAKLDEQGIPYFTGDPRIDSVQRRVTAIQGLYVPISSPAEIGVISSQLAFYGIETKLLGSGEWNSLSELNQNKRYCKGVQFESDGYVDVKNPEYLDFVAHFAQRFNKMPNRTNLYGYAVTQLLLSQIVRGVSTREEMKNALRAVDGVEMIYGRISLFPRRVNSWLQILEYSNETLRRVTEINVQQ